MDFLPPVMMPDPEPEPQPQPDPIDMESNEEEDIEISGAREPVDEEIFKKVNFDEEPKVKEIVDDEPSVEEPEEDELPKKRKYKRKPTSQKQLEALARNREKLRLKRIKEKEERDAIQKEAYKIVKTRKKKTGKVTEDVEPEPKPKPQPKPEPVDVEGAISKALQRHDDARKVRKQEKKLRLKEEQEKRKLREAVQNAIQPGHNPTPDPWASCFNIR